MLSPIWLVFVLPIVAFLAFTGQVFNLFLLDFALILMPHGQWRIAGLSFDATDLVVWGIFFTLIQWHRTLGRDGIPRALTVPFLLLGILITAAYVHAPINERYLTDPVRAVYQLYRYCWKDLLFYPFAFLLLKDLPRVSKFAMLLIVVADVLSVHAIFQGYAGMRAQATFTGGNALGGAMLVPALLALGCFLSPASRRQRIFMGASLLLYGRALLFAGSRGAVVALLAGGCFFFATLLTGAYGRTRAFKLAGYGLAMVVLIFLVKPDVMNRPTVRRILEITSLQTVSTYQWRKEERWPHFIAWVKESPWLGVGTNVDWELGDAANTPHNGYLSLALFHGIPATSLIVFFALYGIQGGIRAFRSSPTARQRMLGAAAASGIVAILVHNYVESTLLMPFVAKTFWVTVALTAILRSPRFAVAPAGAVAARPQRGQRRVRQVRMRYA